MFIKREIEGLRELGHDIRPLSVRRTGPEDHLAADDRAEAERTVALLPPRPGALAVAHTATFVRSPRAYARVAARALAGRRPGWRGSARALVCFALAVQLAERMRRERIAHLHVHFTGPQSDIATLAADLAGRTWSVTVHGPAEFFDVYADQLPRRLAEAHFAVAISDFARSQMLAFTPPERWDSVHVVHCGVDPREFDAPPAGELAGRPLELLTVGRLMPYKGQALLVDAVRALLDQGVDVSLTMIGDGGDRPALERRIAALGLAGSVTLLGAVGQDSIRTHYAACDVFCLASFAEGVPVVLMEAMAMRRPVIATRIAGVSELVDDDVSGVLVRPGRADLLVAAIARLAADDDLRRRMGEAGRERVVAEFDVRANAARLAAIYGAEPAGSSDTV